MIDSPALDNLSGQAFEGLFKRGNVFYRREVQINRFERKNKYLILLNKDCKLPTSFFFLTTSDIESYKQDPNVLSGVVEVNVSNIFPKPTIINCRQVRQFQREDLLNDYKAKKLLYKGELPAHIINLVDDVIRKSRIISSEKKQQILP